MANEVPSQSELYDIFKNELQNRQPGLTDFEEGSNLDAIAGSTSVAAQEIVRFAIDQFANTFFQTASGPIEDGGVDNLEVLAIDHFGESFARPQASNASVNLTFTRPTLDAGNVIIPEGTIVKTLQDVNGVEIRFRTVAEVTMTGLTVTVDAEAILSGQDSNVEANTIVVVETALTDGDITVNNITAAAGGTDIATDAEYREFITNLIETLRGATCPAIEAASEAVPGVVDATVIEQNVVVREYDEASATTSGDSFNVVRTTVYISDSNGGATQVLLDSVDEALEELRACGVKFEIVGAAPLNINWRAEYTLNPAGPNFAQLNSDASLVETFMSDYINGLAIGAGFNIITANQAVLAQFGPDGTNDLTAFITTEPTGNIAALANQKLIAATVEVGT